MLCALTDDDGGLWLINLPSPTDPFMDDMHPCTGVLDSIESESPSPAQHGYSPVAAAALQETKLHVMILSSYTYSSEVVTPARAAPPSLSQSFVQAREAAARRHPSKRQYVEIALRIAKGPAAGGGGGGVRPAYSRTFPLTSAGDDDSCHGALRTVDDVVQWLASPDRPPGIDPADGQLTAPRRALRKRQQVVRCVRDRMRDWCVVDSRQVRCMYVTASY